MRSYFLALGPDILIGWMVAQSLLFVGYLFMLQVREMQRNWRMNAKRERLGLKTGKRGDGRRPFRPRFPNFLRPAASSSNTATAPSQTWTFASTSAGFREIAGLVTGTLPISEPNKPTANSHQGYRVTLVPRMVSRNPAFRSH